MLFVLLHHDVDRVIRDLLRLTKSATQQGVRRSDGLWRSLNIVLVTSLLTFFLLAI